ncbi:U3 small nucleolar ribonucleo protein complex, subunit Mpp10 [Aspergillus avenaceus]|uniref:U3 small nucleolar ribonucleoprotein protein MPP10 n=1 Tax=Aspergillus avenaceus TaxID=36643 RepID=A0A5N6TE97_ASPAV|nr:U3 small nucleolar ribonucleo protein complex, subunit Mpp10 [Aspergillus avenaceus]
MEGHTGNISSILDAQAAGNSLLNATLSSPWAFLRPTTELNDSIVGSAKHILDYLASSISDTQSARQRKNRKRKRSDEYESSYEVLKLKQLYTEGFGSEQIWEQAVRILDSTGQEIERDYTLNIQNASHRSSKESSLASENSDDESAGSEFSDLSERLEVKTDTTSDDEGGADSNLELGHSPYDELDINGSSAAVSDEDIRSTESDGNGGEHNTYTEDPFGLNDGFFSIDDFNKQSEILEREDARGGPDNGSESEEEDIDWHTDPLTTGNSIAVMQKSSAKNVDEGPGVDPIDDYSSSDEEGPTFDSVNLQGESESDEDAFADTVHGTGWINTSDIKYSDFFAPPPRKITNKRSRPLPKTQPTNVIREHDIDRAMADVRRDLFDDEGLSEDGGASDSELHGSHNQKSTHEKQRARIADEIRRLEAANVAKKDWTLAGEARAAERPINSLIEENLEVERIGKPVPVVTVEMSEDIEGLIKRRILAAEFDEVTRRRPGVPDRQSINRSRFELEDTKPQQSLAELYETDHLRATDPNYTDSKNQKLMREHSEINNLWRDISSQLDTLSNWHYKPSVPQTHINIVTDVATIMMEDAQPTAGTSVGNAATLAPQEIYTPGTDGKVAGEVVLRNGVSIAKEEMTREDKSRLRRQSKKQKRSGLGNIKQQPGKATEKQQIVTDLKKSGVQVIGKQGEVTDLHGKKPVGSGTSSGADALKL